MKPDTKEARKRIMTLNRVLAVTSVALGAVLVIQVALVNSHNVQPPQRRFHASWLNHASTLEEGLEQSDHVILGEVIELKRGPDLVVPAPGEPSGEDRVPTMIVKLKVHKTYKGAPGKFVELMQTGHSTDAVLLPGNPFPAAQDDNSGHSKGKRPVQGLSKNSPTAPTAGDSRATILEDDPPYLVGEKYVLFLKDMQHSDGSAAARAGVSRAMKRGLAPEGRLQITKSDRLKPATTRRGFAPNWVGRSLTEFETEITRAR
jgi:hypothetical protein